jgi:hypothetical protein
MKNPTFSFWVLSSAGIIFGSIQSAAQDLDKEIPLEMGGMGGMDKERMEKIERLRMARMEKDNQEIFNYSPLAAELMRTYGGIPQPPPGKRITAHVVTPCQLSPEHCTAKYRQAWEKILLAWIAKPTSELNFMRPRVFEAFATMKDPESVPALAEAFRLTTAQGIDPETAMAGQEAILRILLEIHGKKSLEATLELLEATLELMDFVDGTPSAKEWEKKNQRTFRDSMFYRWMVPTYTGQDDLERERIVGANQWLALIKGYNNPKLSPKNRQLLDRVKAFQRPEPEPKKKVTAQIG